MDRVEAATIPLATRVCHKCKEEKPLDSTHYQPLPSGNLRKECRACQSKRVTAYQLRTAEKNLTAYLAEDDLGPEEVKDCPRCGQTLRRKDFQYMMRSITGRQNYCRDCQGELMAVVLFNKKAREAGCIGWITVEERLRMREIQRDRCARCEAKLTNYTLSWDHIEPRGPGVLNRPSNLQLLCRSCNSRNKLTRKDYRRPEWLTVWPAD